jgi:hypothetical protein
MTPRIVSRARSGVAQTSMAYDGDARGGPSGLPALAGYDARSRQREGPTGGGVGVFQPYQGVFRAPAKLGHGKVQGLPGPRGHFARLSRSGARPLRTFPAAP